MREVLEYYRDDIEQSNILDELGLEKNAYFVCSFHREENVDGEENIQQILGVLNTLASQYGYPIIVSTHPRTKKRLNEVETHIDSLVKFCPAFGFLDYIKLQMNSFCVLSDSGTITEEASILGFPALNVRNVHERPEGFEEAAVMFTGLDINIILQALSVAVEADGKTLKAVRDYQPDNVSHKILRIILSYTGYVNRMTWRKG